ncbi:hypothetical protein EZV62_015330 [Acer yangbiense]|uniref:Thioredoxin domain-containing protein n=1 Tax=Acer yangbiense TaxID=1000413 RepID=A0A5C7HKL4_9ROSI|nr:hypothetical protein EZV62_015330 [Acer yangbiense]
MRGFYVITEQQPETHKIKFTPKMISSLSGEITRLIFLKGIGVLLPLAFRDLGFLGITNGALFDKGKYILPGNQGDEDDSDQHVEFAAGNVGLVTTKEGWEQKLSEASRDGKTVIANFSATWCGPCRMIAPFYCELSEKHPSLMFLVVDVDELTEFSSSWDIKATPTFFFLRDGQQVDKLVGANKPELQKKITAVLDSAVHCQK